MSETISFRKLNHGWNADPNGPEPVVEVSGSDVRVRFGLNPWLFPAFSEADRGALRFVGCTHFRLGGTNDEGWYRGQCRYSDVAPDWGEFYEIAGDDPDLWKPDDWSAVGVGRPGERHFLFYFRDDTFECLAADWEFDPTPDNALFRHAKQGGVARCQSLETAPSVGAPTPKPCLARAMALIAAAFSTRRCR